jgi:hypothetical protein
LLYGERGVGKTSLSNIIAEILTVVKGSSRVNCAQHDNFEGVIRRSLSGIRWSEEKPSMGFKRADGEVVRSLAEMLPPHQAGNPLSPDTVAEALDTLPPYVVLFIDEFDRLPREAAAVFADLIKAVSDRGSSTTIVLVGVAEDINDLIGNHASVERCLRQIRMPRMSDHELTQIIEKACESIGFAEPGDDVTRRIVTVSQGFPHYTHALGQNAARKALDDGILAISSNNVVRAMEQLVEFGDQSHRELYHRAVTGTKKQNLWREVVAACATAETDERGFFSSRAVQDALAKILGRPVIQQTVAFHLGKLTEPSRGPLLQRTGPERRYRYRFINPLMRPFTLIKATADGMIPHVLTPVRLPTSWSDDQVDDVFEDDPNDMALSEEERELNP